MKLYKLTDENDQTCNQTQWGENITHSGTGEGPMCSEGWIHAYIDPLLAIFVNPIHGGYVKPNLWIAEGEIKLQDSLKVACLTLTTLYKEEIPPTLTDNQRIRVGIKCALKVYEEEFFGRWAKNWLSGKDRTHKSAAAATADAAAYTDAAHAADTAVAAYAAYAATAAAAAAAAVTYAAAAAAAEVTSAQIIEFIEEAIEVEKEGKIKCS